MTQKELDDVLERTKGERNKLLQLIAKGSISDSKREKVASLLGLLQHDVSVLHEAAKEALRNADLLETTARSAKREEAIAYRIVKAQEHVINELFNYIGGSTNE